MNREEQYQTTLERNIAAELDDSSTLCPRCGQRYVVPTTAAGQRGLCGACWYRVLRDATEATDAEESARRDYDAARARRSRERRKGKAC